MPRSIVKLILAGAFALAPAGGDLRAQGVDAADVFVRPTGRRPQSVAPGGPRTLAEVSTDDAFASVGRGFDPITNTILAIPCVKAYQAEAQLKGNRTLSNMEIVSDVSSHARTAGESFSAGLMIKKISLGYGSSNAQGDYFNNVESFARIYSRIATEGNEIRDVVWEDDALEILKSDVGLFVEQCGTRYVRAVFSGHLLDVTVRFRLREDKRDNGSAATLSAGVAELFGASGTKAAAETKVATFANAFLWHQGRGAVALPPALAAPSGGQGGGTTNPAPAPAPTPTPGQPAPAPPPVPAPPVPGSVNVTGISALIDWYDTGFRAAVDQAVSQHKDASPLYLIVEDYWGKFRLQGRQTIPRLVEDIATEVASTGQTYATLVTFISTANYSLAAGSPANEFFDEIKDGQGNVIPLSVWRDAAVGDFKAYQAAIGECSEMARQGVGKPDGVRTAAEICRGKLDAALAGADKYVLKRKSVKPTP